MFNLGAPEVLVIAVLALLVLGPQRLPDAARQIGSFMGEIRKLSSGFQRELKTAFEDETEAAARKRGAALVQPTVDDVSAAPPTVGAMSPVDTEMPPAVDAQIAASSEGVAPAVKAPAKRAAATKATPRTKAAAKKAAPIKKTAATKAAPIKKAAGKAAPVKKAAAKQTAAEKAAAKQAPAKRGAATRAPR